MALDCGAAAKPELTRRPGFTGANKLLNSCTLLDLLSPETPTPSVLVVCHPVGRKEVFHSSVCTGTTLPPLQHILQYAHRVQPW